MLTMYKDGIAVMDNNNDDWGEIMVIRIITMMMMTMTMTMTRWLRSNAVQLMRIPARPWRSRF